MRRFPYLPLAVPCSAGPPVIHTQFREGADSCALRSELQHATHICQEDTSLAVTWSLIPAGLISTERHSTGYGLEN